MSDLLHDYVTASAERAGEAVALVMGDERLTYAELETASNRLARMLVDAGCNRGDRVCLLAPKAPATVMAMVATLKAGCTYVPIDTAGPVARLARVVRSADPAAIFTLGSAASLIDELRHDGSLPADVLIGALDPEASSVISARRSFGPRDVADQSGDPLPRSGAGDDAAQILFTSGSTGEPKGVVITHGNVRAFVEWAVSHLRVRPDERLSGHPPLHFDLSTFDIYGAFRSGAALHLVPPETLLPRQLADFISSRALTQWFCVPSTMSYMAKFGAVPDDGFPSLERVLWCGEVLPPAVLAHWMERVPQASFTNLYGPTEATIASSYYTVPSPPREKNGPIPIGQACAGEELLLVDERGEPVEPGQVGELCIAGAGLSPGYWRDEEKTRASFVPDPRPERHAQRIYRTGDRARVGDDGQIYFLGRTDSQIKSRGYRIELGEIEAAINGIPDIAECAVLGLPSDGFEGTSISCAFAAATGAEITAPALRAALSASLPSYMLPTRWVAMDALPKNVNGKIDRQRVRELLRSDVQGER